MVPRLCITFSAVFGLALQANARLVEDWTFEKLVARSDVVVIVQAIKTKKTEDLFPDFSYGHSLADFTAFETIFSVKAFLKGGPINNNTLTLLHFTYSSRFSESTSNGAAFISFMHGPLGIRKHVFKEAKEIGIIRYSEIEPNYLAFLRCRDDGRYEPISGHYDSSDSFREITPALLFWMKEN
jgi:hypothetical protein